MTLVEFLALLLVGYAALCVLLAFVWNAVGEGFRRAVAWCRRRLAWRRGWRGFVAEYGRDFAGPEFRWPAPSATGSGTAGGVR